MRRLSQPIRIILLLCALAGISLAVISGFRWACSHLNHHIRIITNVSAS